MVTIRESQKILDEMNTNKELEKHLLTRSYSDNERIEELLETRYSLTGSQKPTLVLLPTGHDETPKVKSLLHTQHDIDDEQYHKRKTNTRIEVRNYLKKVLNNQKKLIRKIQEYNRVKAKHQNKKPFPIMKLIKHYEIPTYEDYLPVYQLWERYVQNLVFPDVKSPENKLPIKQQILAKLSSAEYTGCLITVLQSRNANVIGLQGIVVYDTQYLFIIVIPGNEDPNTTPAKQIGGFRVIPKRFTLFSFDIKLPNTTDLPDQYVAFTLIGTRIEYRAVDRSTKKFKNHNVDDIL